MKYVVLIVLLAFQASGSHAQFIRSFNEDSLRAILDSNLQDTKRIDVLLKLSESYFHKEPDSCVLYATAALDISRRLNYDSGVLVSLTRVGEIMRQLGKLTGALKNQLEALELSQKIESDYWEANSMGFIGITYIELKDYDHAIVYLKKAIVMRKKFRVEFYDVIFWNFTARAYSEINKPDSAFYFLREGRTLPIAEGPQLLAHSLGDVYSQANNIDSATFYYRRALKYAIESPRFIPNHICRSSYELANLFNNQNQIDSSFYFARLAFRIAREKRLNPRMLDASSLLVQLHRKTGKPDSAFYYQDITNAVYDSLYGKNKTIELQLLLSQEQQRIQEGQRAEERYRNIILIIGLVSITMIVLTASILLFRSNRIKQKTNLALQKTLTELKSTQSQLIQSEKMASLGELTAGIAHEIQNPLNFVNNFSEVNNELIDDLKKEAVSGNQESVLEIADVIKSNQQKINHHGKRADVIVKSMLQHSRTSSGQKELTDLNALCEEYVRLAYHGFKAKDKSFNAIPINVGIETHFDSMLPKVEVVTQDIGRVILNLINNAFYAVGEKSKNHKDYASTVRISTKSVGDKIEIRVEDNGNGIPESLRAKIFQPFFTTKPTGQGTGLGLSLSYDIIKAHGGTLEVNSPPARRAGKEDLGSEFVIQLPAH